MKSVAITGKIREKLGTKESKNLRREGQVPCVVYGGESPIHFSAPAMAFRDVIYTSEARAAHIDLDGKKIEAVMQDIQLHPVSDDILHIDFIQLVEGKPVTIESPANLIGNARGVRNGGKLKHVIRKLSVKALPENLPSSVDIDITELRIGQSIRVSDVKPSANYEILNSPSAVIVTIKTSRKAVAEDEAEGDEEGAEGETAEAAAEETQG